MNSAWMSPVIVSRQSSTTFSDKEAIWADNAESSPYFGNVYICNVAFRSVGGPPEPVDGGPLDRRRRHMDPAADQPGRQHQFGPGPGRRPAGLCCSHRQPGRRPRGVGGSFKGDEVVFLARSFDGGKRFDKPRAVAMTGTVGAFDPVQGRLDLRRSGRSPDE